MPLITSTQRLKRTEVHSLAPALAKIPIALAGGARTLYELATGESAEADSEPGTPRNPQGGIGVDRSGYPWGPAFRHPLWSTTGGLVGGGNVFGEKDFVDVVAMGDKVTRSIAVWVRPFVDRQGAPYTRGYLSLRVRSSGGGAVDCTVTLARAESVDRVQSYSLATSSTTGETKSDVLYIALTPGLNRLVLAFDNADTGDDLIVESASLNQIVTRTH